MGSCNSTYVQKFQILGKYLTKAVECVLCLSKFVKPNPSFIFDYDKGWDLFL